MNRTFKLIPLDQTLSSGRVYPRKVIEEALEEVKHDLSARRLVGEMGVVQDSKIHLDNVSHLVTDLRIEDDILVADIEFLDSPKGKFIQEYMEKKGRITAHPRWKADLRDIGDGKWTVENLTIISIDVEAVDITPQEGDLQG